MKKFFLAAKFALLINMTATTLIINPLQAGLPVFDVTNLIEAVRQTLKQIEQYKTQLKQYENQLKNSLVPSVYLWDKAQSTINNLVIATDTLQYYKNKLGSVDAYLSKFQDVTYYYTSPCYSDNGCSDEEWSSMDENRRLLSESQKKANDALIKGIDQQQSNLKSDAVQLQRLQVASQGAEGQLAALGFANQLASNQSHQLLQIRNLLITQQNAIAMQMQARADKEARQEAASKQTRKGKFIPSTLQTW